VIAEIICKTITPGTVIPKPAAASDFVVKNWGRLRGEPALIYLIPNRRSPEKPYEKGITQSEFEQAYNELQSSGKFTRTWFNDNLLKCVDEGPCSFTTIGGIFQLLGKADYSSLGVYVKK
jgi:hypothetical protein